MASMTPETEVRTIVFDQRLTINQVPYFRGAIVRALAMENAILHNHTESGYRYSYPLVQYKCIDGKASIIAIDQDAISILSALKAGSKLVLTIGNEAPKTFIVKKVTSEWTDMSTGSDLLEYSLKSWLPLNQRNYRQYLECGGLAEKTGMLQSILAGNILSAAKGIGMHISERIRCIITWIENPRLNTLKDIQMTALDVRFKANILLPDNIGLGKGASRGFGIIKNL